MPGQQGYAGDELHDRTVVDRDGNKVGKVADVFLDNDTGRPEWLLVHTGLFGMKETFVPVAAAQSSGEELVVSYDKDFIKDAPHVGTGEELSQADEAALARHYGLQYSEARSDTGLPQGTPSERSAGGEDVGRDTSGPTTDNAMTRSEEELRVDKARRPSELVRLKKHVVTENQQVTVPVQHEELRVEREPITEANRDRAMSGPDLSDEEHEMTLSQEEIVIEKKVVPKERVRLDKEVVTEDQTVDESVRKEQIEVEKDQARK